jgi:hypothetical protein
MSSEITPADVLRSTSSVLKAAGAVAPEPFGMLLRVLAEAAGATSVAIDGGKTEAEVVASIRRIDRIDVDAQNAAAEARIRRRREIEAAGRSLGQVAFEAYSAKRGGKNHDGSPTPTWSQLGDAVREGWEAAADAANG